MGSIRPIFTIAMLAARRWRRIDALESIDPGRLTTRVGNHAGSAGRWSARAERMGLGAAHAPEAIAAVDGLAARRAEWDLGLAAAVRAGGCEHLARAAVAVSTATATTVAAATATTGGVAAAGAVAAIRAAAAALGVPGGLAAGSARGAA